MSRVGSNPITVPSNVSVNIDGNLINVTGPLGTLSMSHLPQVKVEVEGERILVKRKKDDQQSKALHGLTRSLISNLVVGVEKGWQKQLELVGVGFRAQSSGDTLTLAVGYSHPVVINAPVGIKIDVTDNTKIVVSGIDKDLVGQIAAKIKAVRPPDVYKGKGVRYSGEYIRRKPGKAGKVGAK